LYKITGQLENVVSHSSQVTVDSVLKCSSPQVDCSAVMKSFGQCMYLANNYKMLSYRRETALQGALQFSPKVEDWNWEMILYGHYRSIFNHCDIMDLKICRSPWKKRKIRAITAFKVIQGHRGRYQSKARMGFAISD